MNENFGYEDSDYITLNLKFNIKNKLEKKIYDELFVMNVTNRTNKIISLYKSSRSNEKRLIDLLELSLKNNACRASNNDCSVNKPTSNEYINISETTKSISKPIIDELVTVSKPNNLNISNPNNKSVTKTKINSNIEIDINDFDFEIKKEVKNYEKLIDDATDNGFN